MEVDESQISEARKQLVRDLCNMVKEDRDHWEYAFNRMKSWRKFARGLQWPGMDKKDLGDSDRPYVANVTMRHLKQRTASIYAKNPNYKWRRKKRITSTHWDGTAKQLMVAQEALQTGLDVTGRYALILQDAIRTRQEAEMIGKVGETLTCLYTYFISEQTPPAKMMAKKAVLTSLTCGVAYFKQTFQRILDHSPETARAISDATDQLQKIERLAAEMVEGELMPEDADAEQLRLMIQSLESQEQIVLREGLALHYPDPTNIIPDKNMTYLPGFVGCGHVTEQYCLTPDQVRETYGVDISGSFTGYRGTDTKSVAKGTKGNDDRETARVWEIWHMRDNLVYVVCDGYPDFLVEPSPPITYTDRFYPWFVYAPNATDDDADPFPPSDVELMQTQQEEINRAGEGLRDHRFAARPGWVLGSVISEEDAAKLRLRKAHEIISLTSLGTDEDVGKKFQQWPTIGIDMNLYSTAPAFQDILRSVGTQEANLGGASNSTATEASVAESSRQSALASAIDEFDDLLNEMARAGGQILLQEMSAEKVKEIVGPGALWPEMDRQMIAEEIHLEAIAGSSGRPNQAQSVAVMERVYPLMFQMPGIKPEKLLQHAIKVLDDTAVYEDWIDMDLLPITMLSGASGAPGNGEQNPSGNPNSDPRAQGDQGGNNAPRPPGRQPGQVGPGQAGFGMQRQTGPTPLS